MKIGKRFLSFVVVGTALALMSAPAISGQAEASEKGKPHWAYSGEHGPSHWGHMSKDFEACSKGQSQSPIDIKGAEDKNLSDITFSYKKSALSVLNNGHTIQVNYDAGSSIKLNGVEYQLVQFHYHGPSEHTIGGKSFPMEAHFVHKNAKGELAVVGVIIEEGSASAAFNAIGSNIPTKANETKKASASINAEDFLPKSRLYFTYPGSLTTPPCSEGVTWLVLKTPVQMSKAQLKALGDVMGKNNRPVQPINARKVQGDI